MPKVNATDADLLGDLLGYLDNYAGTLDLLHQQLSEGRARVGLDDGSEANLSPLEALNNAIDNLTRKTIEVRAQRGLSD